MTDKEFRELTKSFDDIQEIIVQKNLLKKEEGKLRRKLASLESKYSFLKDLVAIKGNSDKTSEAIKKYFKELGLKIEIVPEKFGVEDLRLWFENKLVIIETTGTEKSDNSENKAHQISKHIPIRKQEYPNLEVYGLFISNHDNRKPFNERKEKSFSKRVNEISESHAYTVTTTTNLLKAFLSIKNGDLTISELIEKLCATGEFKI